MHASPFHRSERLSVHKHYYMKYNSLEYHPLMLSIYSQHKTVVQSSMVIILVRVGLLYLLCGYIPLIIRTSNHDVALVIKQQCFFA